MVVKENRGRKRYILFSHSAKSKTEMNKFIKHKIDILGGKIKSKLINFSENKGVIRIDHNLVANVREIMNHNSENIGIKTIRTSGTLKNIEKS